MPSGMKHGFDGLGTTSFDSVGALDGWVETGTSAARIEAWRE